MLRDNRVVPVDHQQLPTPSEAVNMYRENGGTITEEYEFGVDPLKDHPEKVLMMMFFLKDFNSTPYFIVQ